MASSNALWRNVSQAWAYDALLVELLPEKATVLRPLCSLRTRSTSLPAEWYGEVLIVAVVAKKRIDRIDGYNFMFRLSSSVSCRPM